MQRVWMRVFALASLAMGIAVCALPAFAQNTKPPPARQQTPEIQGRVIRLAPDQFVVKTRDNRELTFYSHPKTKYLSGDKAARYADLRVGSNITALYGMDGTRYMANTVTFVPTTPEGAVVEPAQPVAPAPGTVVQGTVLRVVGQDQVIVRTPDGKEVIVYVTPQTAYQVTEQGGAFADLRPGVEIGVNYDTRDRRFMARRIFRRNK